MGDKIEKTAGQVESAERPMERSIKITGRNNHPEVDAETDAISANEQHERDPFDLNHLRLSQNYGEELGVQKVLTKIPVAKPNRQWWVRTHPQYRLTTAVLEDAATREFYLVDPSVRDELGTDTKAAELFTGINRQGVLFLWPVSLPDATNRRKNHWTETLAEAALRATSEWIRVVSNMSLGAYDIFRTTAELAEPEWPDLPFKEILRIAFRDRYIDSLDHALVRMLRGCA